MAFCWSEAEGVSREILRGKREGFRTAKEVDEREQTEGVYNWLVVGIGSMGVLRVEVV
jgi:hypothetical protein